MTDLARLKRIEAGLSFSPLPRDRHDWLYEPALALLTDEEGDRLVSLFEEITDHENHIITTAISRLAEQDIALLENFLSKSTGGMQAKKANGYLTVLAMNIAARTRPAPANVIL